MNIEKIIQSKNIKLTTARLELLEVLITANKPVCYDTIKDSINMDKATFYRNISKFEDENVITSFESNDKKRYFAFETNLHPHFICNYCNSIECIDNFPAINLKNHSIENIILKGKCKDCMN